MNVQDILNLGDDQLNSMNEKELKQVTTILVSAANKRLKRMRSNVKYTTVSDGKGGKKGKWVEKAGSGVATDAFNYATRGKMNYQKFSVAGKDRNQTYKEFARIRQFMSMKTSTVKGAKEVRRDREFLTFGYSREQLLKGLKGKERTAMIKQINQEIADTYDLYHKFKELNPHYEYTNGSLPPDDPRSPIRVIAEMVHGGMSADDILQSINDSYTQQYEKNTPDYSFPWEDEDFLT